MPWLEFLGYSPTVKGTAICGTLLKCLLDFYCDVCYNGGTGAVIS